MRVRGNMRVSASGQITNERMDGQTAKINDKRNGMLKEKYAKRGIMQRRIGGGIGSDIDGYNSGSGSSSGSGLVSSFFSFPIILARDEKQETKTRKDMNEKE